ncbi:hypothetical protein [Antiquaquibacter soli]|nr:hypothetical protein [Protaetiibacter sp. WY-16]
MRPPSPLPPPLRGRGFSTREASDAGVSRSRTRASDLSAPYRGVRIPRGHTGLDEVCQALATRLTSNQYFSHSTAAALHGLPIPHSESGVIHLTTLQGRSPRIRGVVGHRSTDAHIVTRAGLRMSAPSAAWCELAELATLDELIIAGDALLRRQNPLADRPALLEAISRWGRRRGAVALAEAVQWVRPGTDSPQETRIRLVLLRAGLPEPQVNAVIADADGRFVALGDLVYLNSRS